MGPGTTLAAGLLFASFATVAAAQALEVVGSCREGLPNGAYELRTSDGRLRAVGAFAHGKKTGTFIFWTTNGARVAVIPFEEDARKGTVAFWYPGERDWIEGGRKLEARYVDDRRHGLTRSWYANGTPRSEYRYEHGRLIEARAWSQTGRALAEAEAREQAFGDIESDQSVIDTLVGVVDDHPPRCD